MNRLMVRFGVLFLLALAGAFLTLDSPTSAARDCATTVLNRWSSCDTGYSNTSNQYAIRQSYCVQNAPPQCPTAVEPTCSQGNPTPQQYADCCLAASRAACEATISANYDNRGSSYFSCMGFEGDLSNCVEQVDICPIANDRAAECYSLYQGLENYDARSTCLASSGINQCV